MMNFVRHLTPTLSLSARHRSPLDDLAQHLPAGRHRLRPRGCREQLLLLLRRRLRLRQHALRLQRVRRLEKLLRRRAAEAAAAAAEAAATEAAAAAAAAEAAAAALLRGRNLRG